MRSWLDKLMDKLGYISEDVYKDRLGKAYSRKELSEAYKEGYKEGALQVINGLSESVKKLDNPKN